mmetsp:Transcript_84931/g.243729  ORF Transcript_84931/g.243729 Transcript_84931/m.243729 type:complete len:90 (+) Transcript_84931:427-696(+)
MFGEEQIRWTSDEKFGCRAGVHTKVLLLPLLQNMTILAVGMHRCFVEEQGGMCRLTSERSYEYGLQLVFQSASCSDHEKTLTVGMCESE